MLKKFRSDYPKFRSLFSFQQFNTVQQQCYPKIFNHQDNMIVSAPTSSGKTVLFELLIAKMMDQCKSKCLYLAPIKSLCHEKHTSWRKKFMTTMAVLELTGDTLEMEPGEFGNADIYIATPEKIDYISRKNLNFLKELNLLLIDEIHMLNMEDRGAILEAIVSRIMSINKKIRIMAVSATIPNIKEVAKWLKVPPHLICVFGEEYRPAKLHKVVLGFKPANNDFNFEKMLNFKILDVIRQYSFGRGTLIFCQTQKGTEEACSKLLSQASLREFVSNQHLSMELINASKAVDNMSLKSFLPHGVAFHNASLSMKDRTIVEGLFLDFKVKVLCTTSTLAMGINLPARLVIIKSTKCYKGSGKGYQQYTQIELDQMMGRAGRIPFDKEGTVVIITEKFNYNKYTGQIKLQNLQSQLYYQLIDHLNTEISLKSIQTFSEAVEYFKNSFCYIRMQTSPKLYNLTNSKNDIEKFVEETCMNSIKKLSQYEIVQFIESNQRIFPKQCSFNISKNAIDVETIIKVIEQLGEVKTEKECLTVMCNAGELAKYRSKLDERKCLKELNEKNRYTLKQAISTYEKKCFVLIQSQLKGTHIDNWQLRKQASEMVFYLKRLAYCVKCVALERKHGSKTFWLYLFGCLFHKYFTFGFWETNQEKVLKQIKKVASKWKNINARGIRTLTDLTCGLDRLDIFGNGGNSTTIKRAILEEIELLNGSLQISSKIQQDTNKCSQKDIQIDEKFPATQTNHHLSFIFTHNFDQCFKSIHIIIEHNNSIYHSGYLNANNLTFEVFLKNTFSQKYFIAVLKDGYIGFDEFYWVENGVLKKTELKKEENEKKVGKGETVTMLSRRKSAEKQGGQKWNYDNGDDQRINHSVSRQKKRSHSLESSFNKVCKSNNNKKAKGLQRGKKNGNLPKQITFISTKCSHNNVRNSTGQNFHLPNINEEIQDQMDALELNSNDSSSLMRHSNTLTSNLKKQKPLEQDFSPNENSDPFSTTKVNKKSKQLKLTENFSTIKRKYVYDDEAQEKSRQQNPFGKQLKRSSGFRDLKSYNWKPGFEEIKDLEKHSDEERNLHAYREEGQLFIRQGDSSSYGKSNQMQRKLLLTREDDDNDDNDSKGLAIKSREYRLTEKHIAYKPHNLASNLANNNHPANKNILNQLNDYMSQKNELIDSINTESYGNKSSNFINGGSVFNQTKLTAKDSNMRDSTIIDFKNDNRTKLSNLIQIDSAKISKQKDFDRSSRLVSNAKQSGSEQKEESIPFWKKLIKVPPKLQDKTSNKNNDSLLMNKTEIPLTTSRRTVSFVQKADKNDQSKSKSKFINNLPSKSFETFERQHPKPLNSFNYNKSQLNLKLDAKSEINYLKKLQKEEQTNFTNRQKLKSPYGYFQSFLQEQDD